MSNAVATRFCPLCGSESALQYCDQDGTRTVTRRDLAAGTSKLEIDEIIDGRYRVTGLLGRGGFGAVYAAEHTGTGQAIAIKVMVVGDGGSPDMGAVRRFYKEAQVTAQLRHPNTVRVFDVGQTTTGALFIAMELLHGDTLEERLVAQAEQGEVLGQWAAIDMATAVLRSLAEAHGRGLVHRDLKPANIILSEVSPDEDVIPKVLDFGIARTQDSSLTGQGTALGTPAYMSPEQCMGAAVDGRSDLYSLGVVLYRCVTGRLPFEDRNPLTIMYKHAHAAPRPVLELAPGAVNEALVSVIERALAKAPADRFETAKSMRMALEAVQARRATERYDRAKSQATAAATLEPTAAAAVVKATPRQTEIDHGGDTLATPNATLAGHAPIYDTAMVAAIGGNTRGGGGAADDDAADDDAANDDAADDDAADGDVTDDDVAARRRRATFWRAGGALGLVAIVASLWLAGMFDGGPKAGESTVAAKHTPHADSRADRAATGPGVVRKSGAPKSGTPKSGTPKSGTPGVAHVAGDDARAAPQSDATQQGPDASTGPATAAARGDSDAGAADSGEAAVGAGARPQLDATAVTPQSAKTGAIRAIGPKISAQKARAAARAERRAAARAEKLAAQRAAKQAAKHTEKLADRPTPRPETPRAGTARPPRPPVTSQPAPRAPAVVIPKAKPKSERPEVLD